MDLARSFPRIHGVNLPLLVVMSGLVAILVSCLLSRGASAGGGALVQTAMRALKNNYYLDWLRALDARRPKTFSLRFFGGRWFYLSEPEILKAVYATSFKDFRVELIRRNSRVTMPFADKGVNTTDGDHIYINEIGPQSLGFEIEAWYLTRDFSFLKD
ncbi:hypothetical protein GGI43DRAFT_388832 [Trichoderma evansii]